MRWLLPVIALLLGAACGSTCEVDGALDHASDDRWLCRDGVGTCNEATVLHHVEADGSTRREVLPPAEDPELACFVVYPTVDLRLGTGLHHQTAQVDRPLRWIQGAVRLINTACEIHAPVYRQVTLGTYLGPETARKDRCFDAAYDDVEAAFDAFVARIGDRPFAVVGHSQGGQHLSRLLDEHIEQDAALRARLVVAWPIGWSLGTAEGEATGGSFDRLPVCTEPEQTGCAMGYRSFLAGGDRPDVGARAEGAQQVCTHPAAPEDPDATAPLRQFVARPDDAAIRDAPDLNDPGADDLVAWDEAMTATCEGQGSDRALAVRWRAGEEERPFDVGTVPGLPDNGTHVLDVQIGIADVAADLRRRATAWRAAR